MAPNFTRAGRWFLRSGIQESGGGVARYYRIDLERNSPVSTEITGYALSALLYLHSVTGENEYFNRALAAARFLTRSAWDGHALPFEFSPGPDGRFTYFFDTGIVVRALLAAHAATNDPVYQSTAETLGRNMARDFHNHNGDYHPVLALPGKEAVLHEPGRWSRTPGCYQLKAALGWWNLFEATGDPSFRKLYENVLHTSLETWDSFLPGHPDRAKVVDRLHAFLYFLEGMLPRVNLKRCATTIRAGIARVSEIARDAAPEFERSDVYAQLLRVRIYAHQAGAARLDVTAAAREAAILTGFQTSSEDPRIDGGFYFGRKAGVWLPYVNPVSTAFAVQALDLWQRFRDGGSATHPSLLI